MLAFADLRGFSALLQRGVTLRVRTECSVQSLLVDQLGIDPGYVRDRITTVFLDGEVIDSLDGAVVHDGCSLALSAAMPGLVGATLRKGGPYAAMRAAITHAAEGRETRVTAGGTGTIRVKLFNLLIEEVGPALLAHGIVLERGEAIEALGASGACLDELPPGARVDVRVDLCETPRRSVHS